jgi:tetratricopeptide (TPR) repeat protein
MWSHALQVTDNNWVAHDMVGGLLASEGRREESLANYQAALLANPTDPAANVAIAIDDQRSGRPEAAIQLYRNALRELTDPLEQAKAFQNMGIAYRSLGDATKAAECFRKAIQLRQNAK